MAPSRSCDIRCFRGMCHLQLVSQLLILFLAHRLFLPRRWSQHIPLKCHFSQDLHDATSHKMAFLIATAMKTWNHWVSFTALLIYCNLLSGSVSNSDYIKSNDTVTVNNWEGFVRNLSWLNSRYYPLICLGGLKNTMKNLSWDSQWPNWLSKKYLPEYKPEPFPLWVNCSVYYCFNTAIHITKSFKNVAGLPCTNWQQCWGHEY